MIAFWDNLLDYSGVALTPSSEDSLLLSKNVLNDQRKKIWQSGATLASETLTFDLGSAKAVTAMIACDVYYNGQLDALHNVYLNASTDNFASSNVAIGAAGLNGTPTLLFTFDSTTYRYWRFTIFKDNSTDTVGIGRLFLGNYDDFGPCDYESYQEETVDPSAIQTSIGGQEYSDLRDKYLTFQCNFPFLSDTERQRVQAMIDKAGKATPFFVQPELGSRINLPIYVKLKQISRPKMSCYDQVFYWAVDAQFKEQL